MPKVKVSRKSTWVDMTAMCDVAFLLLTFFMLTSNFTQKEPVMISTPSSISEIKIPETNIMMLLITNDGKVFFGIDGQENRMEMLKKIGEAYKIDFTDEELKRFSVINSFGVPVNILKPYIAMSKEERDFKENALGIPCDSIDNQLINWIKAARSVNKKIRVAIKADQRVSYPVVKNVMNILRDLDENRYNLITSLEQNPEKRNTIIE